MQSTRGISVDSIESVFAEIIALNTHPVDRFPSLLCNRSHKMLRGVMCLSSNVPLYAKTPPTDQRHDNVVGK